jgi:FdrA protein
MQVSREIGDRPGVTAVLVAMATPLNLELAAGMGLGPDGEAKPDQLLIALRATDDAELTGAVAAVEAALAHRERSVEAQAIPPWRSSACRARTPPPRPPTP